MKRRDTWGHHHLLDILLSCRAKSLSIVSSQKDNLPNRKERKSEPKEGREEMIHLVIKEVSHMSEDVEHDTSPDIIGSLLELFKSLRESFSGILLFC
jgi:hypothetical protein